MRALPPLLKPHLAKAKELLESSAVQEIQFSGPTYQVKIGDPDTGEDVWVFLQLEQGHKLREAFCSCDLTEKGCWHLTLAYITLFDGSEKALHERFKSSFWNIFGKILFLRYNSKKLQGPELKFPRFSLEAKTEFGRLKLEDILRGHLNETEENSIKFSNLSEEELLAWERGNPSESLKYELSPWSDLAKFLMELNDQKTFQVSFSGDLQKGLPQRIHIENGDLKIHCSLSTLDWEKLIPTLNSIKTPLQVFNRLSDSVKSMRFDPSKIRFELNLKDQKKNLKGFLVGDWNYVPNSGFYARNTYVSKRVAQSSIEEFLNAYFEEIGPLIQRVKWHHDPVSLRYQLHFDEAWNLHIKPYIEKPGDLEEGNSICFGPYCYLSKGDFYKIHAPEEDFPSVILEEKIADFLRDQMSWLNQQEGFEIHLGSFETQTLYQVDENGHLSFQKRGGKDQGKSKEFGPWIYLEGEGFFNRFHSHVLLPIDLGQIIRSDRVASFIRQNKCELELVADFFMEEVPLQDVGIDISFDTKNRLFVEPHYILKPQYAHLPFRFYEEWIYVEGHGFVEIPPLLRLPEKVKDPFWISSENIPHFLDEELPKLQNVIRNLDRKLTPPLSLRLNLTSIEEAPHHSWWIKLHYQTDRGEISIYDLHTALLKRKSYLFSEAGCIDLREDRFKWVKRLRNFKDLKSGFLQLSTVELLRLNAYEEILARSEVEKALKDILDLKKVLPFDCSELKSILRPYQHNGAEWLFSLYSYLLGGLLCDEMGLGKTHQAMALIAAIRKIRPKAKFLAVCPTSVLYHWQDKLAEYFPTLSVITFHGPFRKRKGVGRHALLLTSYGVLRSERDWLSELHFDAAIYDEIQVAKNHKSKLFSALQNIQADVKVGLTGTPIENRLRELKALFDLILPGYMPIESDYNRLIIKPIEKERDMQQKGLLQRLVHPFVLRRQKVDVLNDLPDKIEEIAFCDLHPSQDKLYRETLLLQRNELFRDLFDGRKPVPFLHIFSLLSRLKQVCDHPALYLKVPLEYKKYHSGKWELFLELLREARESGQKVVVYSQYLGMLDIIENYLKEESIGFASLRGSTRDRKAEINFFTNDRSCEVFVASLKAAGLGIDLTAASVVIHYDRWWNAARENQATDRVHRFGQHRGVQVFKLVTKNTFEERIHQIIERKKELMEEAIGVDDHEILKAFTREELYELLLYQEE